MDNTTISIFDSECIRKKSNWSKSNADFKLDSKSFNPELFLKNIKSHSPKLHTLLQKIQKLDKEDMKKDGHYYKHFIFCDVKSSNQGARMLASAFMSSGYELGYYANLKRGIKREFSTELPETPKSNKKNVKKVREDTPRPSSVLPKEKPVRKNKSMSVISEEDEEESQDSSKKSIKKVREDTPRPSSVLPKEKPVRKNKSMSVISEEDEEESTNEQTGGEKSKNRFEKIELLSPYQLKKTINNNFYLLSSVNVFDQPINVSTKKQILANFNKRPENVHGKEIRFIIMDSGFKEGIDLFDVKYVHIFEPPINSADQKQVIGRATRTCGQKGLEFHPTKGWPLHVFVYDLSIHETIQNSFLDSKTAFELYLKSLNLDMKLINFTSHMEKVSIFGSVDYELNKAVHEFSISTQSGGGPKKLSSKLIINGTPIVVNPGSDDMIVLPSGKQIKGYNLKNMDFSTMRKYIRDHFSRAKWEDVKMENLCDDSVVSKKKGGANIIKYTPTQRFIKEYFSPQCPVKGMLLWHSTGTGKTCSAIAAASSTFAVQDYTILWVTRTTLKNDIWKNMFDQICNEQIRTMVADGVKLPSDHNKRMRLLSKAWSIRPISYKQFSNLVSQENNYYHRLVNINGSLDPLRKTLLIIDEAHKLYGGGDLSSIERPDMKALHKSLMNSYSISGRDSVRVLLMTATPITENGMEIVKLINLCKPIDEQMPEEFSVFSEEYLKEDGDFTKEGETKYLDNIAGHVSYLNREKDARQFAQPILEKVMTPLIENIQDVKKMDKRYVRSITTKDIDELKKQIEDENNNMDDDFKDLESSRFYELRDICDDYDGIVQKGCLKVANQNIRDLVKEAKYHVKGIKDKIKKLRTEMKNKNLYRKNTLQKMTELHKKNPEKLKQFQEGVYFALKYDCGKALKDKHLDKNVNIDPRIVTIENELKEFDERIEKLDNELKLITETHRNKVKELKKMLRTGKLTDSEIFVIKDAITLNEEKYKSTMKIRKKEITDEKKNITKSKQETNKRLTQKRRSIKENIKENKKEEDAEEKDIQRAEKKAKKALRKQGEIREEFKEGLLKEIVDTYKRKTNVQFNEIKGELIRKENEKRIEKERKEMEKEEKQREKEEKKRRKEEEKTRKNREKENRKTKKKRN